MAAARVVVTVTAASCPHPPALKAKRDGKNLPSGLKLFAEKEISSACARLSIKPKATTTITETAAAVIVVSTLS
jgi:hypothetical protein